ncbi:MAG: ATP-dependent helicase [Nocardioidaceae bacterium]|nr:ATP-dependent helicase [Nocardioidaceae bacterium]
MSRSDVRTIGSARELCQLMRIPFSAQQLDAITAPLAPGVIVAGAGSGKTTVMAARVVWLVGTGVVRPEQVLGLTFTNKAATELGHRVRDFLEVAGVVSAPGWRPGGRTSSAADQPAGDELAEPTVLTYHTYAAQLLAEHGLRIGHEPDSRLMADASRFQVAERAIRRYGGSVEQLTTSLPHVVRYVLALDAQLSEHLVTPDQVRRWQSEQRPRWQAAKQTKEVADVIYKFAAREELLALVEGYRGLKAELGVIDFSDQMALGAALAAESPEVGAHERERFRIVLLDEYQDTSIAQARLLTHLFSGRAVECGRGHAVTAVGDPCQAIYGWRGASAGNISGFATDFPQATDDQTRVFPLSVNRRSLTTILDLANTIAQPLHVEHTGVEPLSARPGAGPGQVRAAVLETFGDELAWLAREVPRAHQEMRLPKWSEIGILVRDNKTAYAVHDALVAADVPVEVVGLSGLLTMPEVVEVIATLEILHDVTANAALLRLLTGPRWRIGARDLALLGRRARMLAHPDGEAGDSMADALAEAVAGVDPADVVSLLEAMQSPGAAAFSAEARDRFSLLSSELRELQRHIGEPLLDLVRRVIDTIGIDIELASSNSRVAESRRGNLSTFLDAVSAFAGTDKEASLPGLLAYLQAEEEYGQGLSLALPTEANSVKLLTVHKAKGLEWDVVFVPGLTKDVFPTGQARPRWTTTAQELPWPMRGDEADLPEVTACSNKGLKDFTAACRDYQRLEELRLAYVAFTRARNILVTSAYWWGPEQIKRRGPSELMETVLEVLARRGQGPEEHFPPPAEGAANPANRKLTVYPWPVALASDELERRRDAAVLFEQARSLGWAEAARVADEQLLLVDAAEVQQWDRELDRLIDEVQTSRAQEVKVELPSSLSATTALRLHSDPDQLARDLARPMPRKPSAAARFGTRFHAWVETHLGRQLDLIGPEDLPGRGDEDIESDEDFRSLVASFEAGHFGNRPAYAIEAPFSLLLAGQVIRGRIDAVYETADGFQVVDWKTNQRQTADPLQLALYRLAWAELHEIEVERVQASFYYVRSDDVVSYDDLPGRVELEQQLMAERAAP